MTAKSGGISASFATTSTTAYITAKCTTTERQQQKKFAFPPSCYRPLLERSADSLDHLSGLVQKDSNAKEETYCSSPSN
jgi:hypothetical protein